MLKVLIIDDDDIVLLVERKMLERCGISAEAKSFNSGITALQFLQNEGKNQDFLILLDINMPRMNGWEFLDKLQGIKLGSSIFVIMVTSSIDRYDKETAEKYQKIISFIEKPITMNNCSEIKSLPELKDYFTNEID